MQSKIINTEDLFNFSQTWYLIKEIDFTEPKFLILFPNEKENHTIPLYDGQPYLPDGLSFPSVIKGDLRLNHHLLPSAVKLPEWVEGTKEIQYCRIPPTWKFPHKLHRLKLIRFST